jgi:hypothetical protein
MAAMPDASRNGTPAPATRPISPPAPRGHAKHLPDVAVCLSGEQARTVLAALADVARREREWAALLRVPGRFVGEEAVRAKEAFAAECDGAAGVIGAAVGARHQATRDDG